MGLPIVSEMVTILMSHPLLAWFTILFVLGTDTFLTGLVFPDGSGLFGYILSSVLSGVGINIPVTTFQITFVVAVVPVLIFVLKSLRKN